MKVRSLSIAACLLLAACGGGPPDIQLTDAWARETRAGQTSGAVYLTIRNAGGSADRLTAVSTPAASMAQLHESRNDNGVMRMRHLPDGIAIPAGGEVRLAPNGQHIMLMGVREALTVGRPVTVRLTFERSGERQVPVTIVGALSQTPAPAGS